MGAVLLVGASGLIGLEVVKAVSKKYPNTVIYATYCQNKSACIPLKGVEWIPCDCRDLGQVEYVMGSVKPKILVQCAWYTVPQRYWLGRENVDWVFYSLRLYENFVKNGGEKFIGLGTDAEEWQWLQKPPFVTSKFCLYQLLSALQRAMGWPGAIVWPQISWVFSENEPKQKFFSCVFAGLMKNQPIVLYAKNTQYGYLHVQHYGEAIAACCDLQANARFVLAVRPFITLEEIIDKMASMLKVSYRIEYQQNHTVPCGVLE